MTSILDQKVSVNAASSSSPDASCRVALTHSPWDFDAMPYGPGASANAVPLQSAPKQAPLPVHYRQASLPALRQKIQDAQRKLGDRVLILGHFYQRDDIVHHADVVGDSFQLAQAILKRPRAEFVVFCGVHFMAETAHILSQAHQTVILPHLGAGCSMADMADAPSVEACWAHLTARWGSAPDAHGRYPVIPVTYMNSSAALKAFCGRHEGIVCTSSNARSVLAWAFARGQRVLFFPDQHLGRNTAHALGIAEEKCVIWDPALPSGGLSDQQLHHAQVLLWKGFCSVHQRFTVEQIQQARQKYPQVRVIVHPECCRAVVDAADENGSTDYICRAIRAAPPGGVFAVGTEINLVNRLAHQHPEQTIFCLDPIVCPCSTMYRIHPAYLAWVLEGLTDHRVHNSISVERATADQARTALERMLAVHP